MGIKQYRGCYSQQLRKYNRKSAGSCVVTVTSFDNPDIKAEFKVTVNEPVKVEMTYMDGILIVNKTYPLPQNYNPVVNPEAKAALDKMFGRRKDGAKT